MIQYILEVIAFQLVFLIIYDFWLKRETFFQWNRAYLISTYVLSMVLPWVKIEALKTSVPQEYYVYPEFLWKTNDLAISTVPQAESAGLSILWEHVLLFGGMFLASLFFANKLRQLYVLKKKGTVQRFSNFTQIIIANSQVAFSFFKSIFLGDKVLAGEYKSIIAHELVHIKQRHSYDLLFFELMRIVCWFNPLVYVYQSRLAELHEFIADAQVAKNNKKEHYQLLLSQVFETQHISFINQFFKSSLIKKRIVMLQKSQSKRIWQLKYLLLVPMVLGMLAYTSAEKESIVPTQSKLIQNVDDQELIENVQDEIEKTIEDLIKKEEINIEDEKIDELNERAKAIYYMYRKMNVLPNTDDILSKKEFFRNRIITKMYFTEFTRGVSPKDANKDWEQDLPSTELYESYLGWNKAFELLDPNLKFSIDSEKYSLRILEKEDKNLGPGEFVIVDNLEDLSGLEMKRFNQALKSIDGTDRMLVISDDSYSFLIKRKPLEKLNHANTKLFRMLEDKHRKKYDTIKDKNQNIPFAVVEEVPIFPGCEDAENTRACFQASMQLHISKHFSYPKEAQEKGIQGRVSLMFTIDKEGNINNIRKRGPDKILEDEAERIISLLPQMRAGKQKGETVNVPFSIPITFKLNESNAIPLREMRSNYNSEVARLTKTYNELVNERNALVKNPEENGVAQKDLDEKLFILKIQINEALNNLSLDVMGIPIGKVDEAPIYPGCDGADDKVACFTKSIQKHIASNFKYPIEAQQKEIEGRVSIMFMINKEGDVEDIRMRGPDNLLEKEAQRIIELLPKMKPGRHRGKAVKVPFSIPISFKLPYETIVETPSQELEIFPFATVEEVPIFPGCEGADDKVACFRKSIQKHIASNFEYPKEAQQKQIQGRVSIMFMINKEGDVEDIRKRGPDNLLEKEAQRIIELLPKMKPGKHKGKAVKVPFSIPITFKLHEKEEPIKD